MNHVSTLDNKIAVTIAARFNLDPISEALQIHFLFIETESEDQTRFYIIALESGSLEEFKNNISQN